MTEHRPDPEPDFLDGFAQTPEEGDAVPSARAVLLTSAGMTLIGVLSALGFVGGAMWASLHEPDLDYQNIAGELAIKIGYALFVGVIVGAAVLALSVGVVGFFVLRERRRSVHGTNSARTAPDPAQRSRHDRAH